MSNRQDTTVINVDFRKRKLSEQQEPEAVTIATPSDTSISDSCAAEELITEVNDNSEEWSEDLTPKERTDKLREDLEFSAPDE